jgi:hypothetical protein
LSKGPQCVTPNYYQERAQKNRARARQKEKLERREEVSARRKALREGEAWICGACDSMSRTTALI